MDGCKYRDMISYDRRGIYLLRRTQEVYSRGDIKYSKTARTERGKKRRGASIETSPLYLQTATVNLRKYA